ncbi:MAG: amidohydrolase, partial [Pygmaiobacter sp.]
HASGHMGVCNSAALAALDISAASPDPEGGKIGRMPGSCEPSGYLEETAFTMIGSKIPQPTTEQLLGQLERAQDIYLSYGIATAQDGLTRTQEWALLRAAAEQKKLKLDIVSYIDLNLCKELAQDNPYFKTYRDHLKLGGYKIFLDGSPQGRTAWITEDYLGQAGDHGYPIYDTTRVKDFMVQALTEDTQILVHCNGDAAAQQLLDAYRDAMAKTGKSGIRPVMIHAQLLRRDQLALLPPLGMIASFFVAHTRYWGDVHLENLGKERADYISPVQSAIQHGVRYTFHQDTPVLPPDMLDTVQCAVERKTKGGQLLAQSECVSVYDALKAVTINAAYQYFEEYTKGSIAVGKVADFVILDQDPLHTPLESLRNIRVLNTIKHGVVVYTNHT